MSNEQFLELMLREFRQNALILERSLQELEQIKLEMITLQKELRLIEGELTLVKGNTFTLNNRMAKLETLIVNNLVPKVKVLIDVI